MDSRAAAYFSLSLSLAGCGLTSFPEPTHREEGAGGHGGTNGNDAQTGEGCNGSKPFPSTPVLDSFDRSDGPVGSNWTGETQGFSLVQGKVSGDATGGESIYFHERFGGDQEVFATLSAFDPELYDMSLIFKADTASGCPSLRLRYANGYTLMHDVLITKCEDATYGILLDHEVPPLHPGARIGARAFTNGCVEVFARDGLPDGGAAPRFDFLESVKVPSFATIAYPGYLGLYSQPKKDGGNGVASVWDDFGGGTVR
nr:hypothetical protein Hi04_10k_c5591_00024 [uncultured bacterium]